MVQSEIHVQLFRLEDLALDYINQTTGKPYTARSLRNWCEHLGLQVYKECINQVAADILDHYHKVVTSVRGRNAQAKAEQQFIAQFQMEIKQANQLMTDPRRYASQVVSPLVSEETSYEAISEAIDETNETEAADGAIVLMQGGIAQLKQQTAQAADQFVAAVQECADTLADVVEAAPTIFVNRLAERARTMPQIPDMSKLLGVKPKQLRGTDD